MVKELDKLAQQFYVGKGNVILKCALHSEFTLMKKRATDRVSTERFGVAQETESSFFRSLLKLRTRWAWIQALPHTLPPDLTLIPREPGQLCLLL